MGKREKSACTQHGSRGRCDEAQAGERHEGGHEGRARGMVPEKKAREAVSARESGSEERTARPARLCAFRTWPAAEFRSGRRCEQPISPLERHTETERCKRER